VRDEHGKPVTRWDGHTMTTDPATGREVPDEHARIELERYVNPRQARWPSADFIIGNPPFIGTKRVRAAVGDGYLQALWEAYPGMPHNIDIVLYWWKRGAELVGNLSAQSCGLITSNSINQFYNHKVIEKALGGLKIYFSFAIPDHPWFVSGDMAAVRVAMTVIRHGKKIGILCEVKGDPVRHASRANDPIDCKSGEINSTLTLGTDATQSQPLLSNTGLSWQGIKLVGRAKKTPIEDDGFLLRYPETKQIDLQPKRYLSNRDLMKKNRDLYVIDTFGMSEHDLRLNYPKAYERLLTRLKPFRKYNRDRFFREYWWLHGRSRGDLRDAINLLDRYIVTPEVSKHRPFVFVKKDTLIDASVYAIASEDSFLLGVLSSKIHVEWSRHDGIGGKLGVGNDPRYQNQRCFDPFPFPDAGEVNKTSIRDLAEELDALRKRVLAEHEDLTLTGLYNVREKLVQGEALTAKERDVHERGCVGTIKHLHEEIDCAVADAYGWPADLDDEAILARVVALNRERRAEERRGHVRWLRPDYQAPRFAPAAATQEEFAVAPAAATAASAKPAWPKALPERITAVRDVLAKQDGPRRPEELAGRFKRGRSADVAEILETLTALGLARHTGDGRFAL